MTALRSGPHGQGSEETREESAPTQEGPSYEDSVREGKARELKQAPIRKKLEKLRDVDGLAKLVAASHASFATLPWLQWIFNAPRTVNLRYASVSDEPDQQAAMVRVLAELIDHDAAFDQIDEAWQWSEHALASLIDFEELAATDRNARLARGVDPTVRIRYPVWQDEHGPFAGYVLTRSALDAALASEHPVFLATIEPYVNADAWPDAYLHAAIGLVAGERKVERLDEWSTWLDRAGDLDRVMTKLGSAESGALVHVLCGPAVAPEYLERAIARLDVSLATQHPLTHLISTHFGAGFTMRTPVGATPRDMVETTAGVARRAQAGNAQKPNKDYRADETEKLLAYTAKKRTLLEAAGAKRSAAASSRRIAGTRGSRRSSCRPRRRSRWRSIAPGFAPDRVYSAAAARVASTIRSASAMTSGSRERRTGSSTRSSSMRSMGSVLASSSGVGSRPDRGM